MSLISTASGIRSLSFLLLMVAIIVACYTTNESKSNPPQNLLEPQSKETQHVNEIVKTMNETVRKDFRNRASPIPKEKWSKLDNKECYTMEHGNGPELAPWQRRAPYALIIGAMKAGTTALSHYIQGHSLVIEADRKELHFFDFAFDQFTSSEDGILRRSARSAYRQVFLQYAPVARLKKSPLAIAIDDSPRYLFWSDRIPARVLCVTPWVKILVVLRNPIDRAFSQFNMFSNKKGIGITFEEWIEQDMSDLRKTGVIQDTIPFDIFSGSMEQEAAWKAYTRLGTHAPIGRGLYSVQLRQWFKAFEAAGKSRDKFLIIQSELMKEDPQLTYKGVLDFLGLPEEPLVDGSSKFVGKYHTKLSEETRSKLNDFYSRYNQELYRLLGGDWVGVWDP